MLAQSFWLGPRNVKTLPAQCIDDEVCAIRTETRFRTCVGSILQFSAAKQIRQAKLLADSCPKPCARKSTKLQGWCFADFAINYRASSQTQRPAMQPSIKEVVDFGDWKIGVVMGDRDFFPFRAGCRVLHKANLVGAQFSYVTL